MKKKKTILAAIILLCVFLVGGAIAYFTDIKSATNTFTIGNVAITLTEPNWSTTDTTPANGVPDAAENIVPNQNITKDPTINNVSTTNPAFVFAKVVIPCTTDTTPAEAFTLTTIGSGWNLMTDGACTLNSTTNKYEATKVYNYGTASAMSELAAGASTAPVFSSVTVGSSLTGLTGNVDVVVTGYAIQTKGLTSTAPSAVWSNF